MRKIILLSLNLLIMHAAFSQLKCRVGESNITSTSSIYKSDTAARVTLRCYRVLPDNTAPLLIINNKITPLGQLSAVNPNDILSVEIIKPPKATAMYGADGVGGAIIVTLKTRQLMVKDAENGKPIDGASILLKGSKGSQMFIADSNGIVQIPRMSKNDSISVLVSSVGYKTYESSYNPALMEILLDRNSIVNDTFIVKSNFRTRTIACCVSCGVSCVFNSRRGKDSLIVKLEDPFVHLDLYPNPVRQGASIRCKLNNSSAQNLSISIYSASGNLLRRSVYQAMKGDNRITLETTPTWPPGMYFIEIKEAGSSVAIKTKFIIQ